MGHQPQTQVQLAAQAVPWSPFPSFAWGTQLFPLARRPLTLCGVSRCEVSGSLCLSCKAPFSQPHFSQNTAVWVSAGLGMLPDLLAPFWCC